MEPIIIIIDSISEVADESFLLDNDTLLKGIQVMSMSALEFLYTCMQCKKGIVKYIILYAWSDIARLNTKKQT